MSINSPNTYFVIKTPLIGSSAIFIKVLYTFAFKPNETFYYCFCNYKIKLLNEWVSECQTGLNFDLYPIILLWGSDNVLKLMIDTVSSSYDSET